VERQVGERYPERGGSLQKAVAAGCTSCATAGLHRAGTARGLLMIERRLGCNSCPVEFRGGFVSPPADTSRFLPEVVRRRPDQTTACRSCGARSAAKSIGPHLPSIGLAQAPRAARPLLSETFVRPVAYTLCHYSLRLSSMNPMCSQPLSFGSRRQGSDRLCVSPSRLHDCGHFGLKE